MGTSDERAAGQHGSGEDRPAVFERAGSGHAETSERLQRNFRHQQERLREVAAAVAATENSVAATLHDLAEQALRAGRIGESRRLDREAAAALSAAHREHQRAAEPVPGARRAAGAAEPRARVAGPRDAANRDRP